MISLLHADVRERAEVLRKQFADAQPFRRVVMDEFLSADFCRKLMAEFPPFEGQYALNERGEPGRKAVLTALAELGRREHSPGLRVERSGRPGNRDPDRAPR
jgi:hypothetical protein